MESNRKRIFIVDGNSILNRAYYGIRPLTTKEGIYTNAVYGMITMLSKQLELVKPDRCAIAFDRREPTFRHKAYAEYKAGRHASPDELHMQFPYAKDCASAMGFSVIEQPGYEADDILGTLSKEANDAGWDAYLLTGDRDALQLIGDHTTVLLATNKETVTFDRTHFIEEYGVTPEQFVDVKALMGDSSDNIPGVAGVGEKTALKLISEYRNLDALYEALDDAPIAKGVKGKLQKDRDNAFFSRMLAAIVRDAPLDTPFSALPAISEKEDLAALRTLFIKLEFSALIKRMNLDAVQTADIRSATLENSPLPTASENAPLPTASENEILPTAFKNDILPTTFKNETLPTTAKPIDSAALAALPAETVYAVLLAKSKAADIPEKNAFAKGSPTFDMFLSDGITVSVCPLAEPAVPAFLVSHRIVTDDTKTLYHTLFSAGILHKIAAENNTASPSSILPDQEPFSEPDILFDTTLAGYVLSPGESDYSTEKLTVQYLGTILPKEMPSDPTDSTDPTDTPVGTIPHDATAASCAAIARLYPILQKKIIADGMEALYRDIELPLARVLFRMELRGFRVDLDGLDAYGKALGVMCDQYIERIHQMAGVVFNVNSPKQLAEVLYDTLGLPCPSSKRSTNAEILERLRPYHPIIADILEYRQVAKLKSTYTDGLIKVAGKDGRIHSCFNQTVTATGRLSSTEPNLQNIPIRTELGRELRKYFVAKDENHVLVDADYSQIELRLLAAISGDETMIEAYQNGTDIHAVTASQVFGIPLSCVTPEMRKRAKAVNFGIVYGISDYSLAMDIGVTKRQAGDYIDSYLKTYPKVNAYLHEIVKTAKADGFVTTLFGRRRYIPELTATKKMLVAFGERVAMNSPIQGSAADIIKAAMVKLEGELSASGLDAHLILQVHDELIVECHKDCLDTVKAILKRVMENTVSLAVPLTVDVQAGDNWFDGH